MGLEIHAIGTDKAVSMTRWFNIWDYRRCVALTGFASGIFTKEEAIKEFRETADLQLYSKVKIDDDGNYIDPLDDPNFVETLNVNSI